MCLMKYRLFKPKPRKAKKDITVYKIVELTQTPEGPVFHSPFNRVFEWHINKVASSVLGVPTPMVGYLFMYEIDFGLHSFYKEEKAYEANALTFGYGYTVIFKATIPKGSLYFKGTNGEVVSNRLILNEQITFPYGY